MIAPDDLMGFGASGPRSWGRFAGDVAAMRARLAGRGAVCNLLSDRYAFMAGLAAAMLEGRRTVLPQSGAPQAVAAALSGAQDPVALTEETAPPGVARLVPTLGEGPEADPAALLDALARAAGEVHVFTSGSTGTPRRHVKTWRILAGGAAATDDLLALHGFARDDCALVGTTPHRHMYGLEATVFAALGFGRPVHDGGVFFPADLEAATASAAAAGLGTVALISSPAHLKYLEPAIMATPAIRAVISATGPLPEALAARLEARGDLRVLEIYGSTETGSIAGRRTVEGPAWTLMAGAALVPEGERMIARAPHLPGPVPLGDAVSLLPDGGSCCTAGSTTW